MIIHCYSFKKINYMINCYIIQNYNLFYTVLFILQTFILNKIRLFENLHLNGLLHSEPSKTSIIELILYLLAKKIIKAHIQLYISNKPLIY